MILENKIQFNRRGQKGKYTLDKPNGAWMWYFESNFYIIVVIYV